MRAVRARDRRRAHGLGVGAGAGFGQAERRHALPARALREPALLLVIGAEERDPLAADGLVGAEVHGERGIGRADFGEHAAEEQGGSAEAAVFLGDVQAHHAEFGHAGAHFVGEAPLAVETGGVHGGPGPVAEGFEDGVEALPVGRREFREGEDEVLANLAEKNAAGEGRVVLGVCQVGGHDRLSVEGESSL